MVFSKDINALAHQEAILKRRFICACASVPALVAMYALVKSCLRGGLSLKKLAVADLKHLNHPSTYLIFGSLVLRSYFLTKLDGVLQKKLLEKICSNYDQYLVNKEKLDDLKALNEAIEHSQDSRIKLLHIIHNNDLFEKLHQTKMSLLMAEISNAQKLSSLICSTLSQLGGEGTHLQNTDFYSKSLQQLELEALQTTLEKLVGKPLVVLKKQLETFYPEVVSF